MRRLRVIFGLMMLVGVFVQSAAGSINVYLDFSGFTTQLNAAAGSAGVTAFSATEISSIQSGIQSQIATVYSAFSVNVTASDPGGNRERVWFGATTATPGALGVADGIDWLNRSANDVARIYTGNFDFILDEFSGSTNRAEQINQITTALAGTGAHELLHNLGMRHYDSFGDTAFTGGANGGGASGGIQNTHIMATGSTGLGEIGRETQRTLSDLVTAKMSFTSGVVDTPLGLTAEQAAAHATAATAQAVTLAGLPLSGYGSGVLVAGAVAASAELDYYSFSGKAGDKVALNVISSSVTDNGGFFPKTVDSVATLFGTDGTTLLANNDDIYYSTTSINSGSFRTLDSLVLNYLLPADGTYYARVRGFGSDTGQYHLLLASTQDAGPPPVPEPGTLLIWAMLGGISVATYRRRRRG